MFSAPRNLFFSLCAFAPLLFSLSASAEATNDYTAVHAIFDKYCMDCHESKDPEANLVLDSFETLMKGGESGAVIVPGKSGESLLVRMVEGKVEKEGKKLIMPPGKKSKKLEAAEIAVIKAWIDAGAQPPTQIIVKELVVPKILPKGEPRRSVFALAQSPKQKLIAAARYAQVDLLSPDTRSVVRSLTGHRGNVNGVAFSPDGSQLFSVSGENALLGEIKQWSVEDGSLIRTIEGHKDMIYSVAVSPDGKILATGGYDQKIKLWDVETGKEIKTLNGHNGAVFGLAFRPDGKILASASADRTVKLWNVAKGERTDTLSQPLKEVYCVAFSRDGKKLYAGGVDSRIRIWQISESAVETTDPILESKYAHEGSILRLNFSEDGKWLLSSSDDRTVKLWDAAAMREALVLEKQPDWAAGLCFAEGKIVIGRMDGSVGFYDLKGKLLSTNVAAVPTEKQTSALNK
jgi:hypothetical protein